MNTNSKRSLAIVVGAALLCLAAVSGSTFAQAASCNCADACRGKGGVCFNNCSTRCAQTGTAKGKY